MFNQSKNTIFFILLSLILASNVADDSPSSNCKLEDVKCLRDKFIDLLIDTISKMDPIGIPNIHVAESLGVFRTVKFILELKDNKLKGLKNVKLVDKSGFNTDLKEEHKLVFKVNKLEMHGRNSINGRFSILPIKANGNYDLVAEDVTLTIRFKGLLIKRDGSFHLSSENLSHSIEAKHVLFDFDNILCNSFELTKHTLKLINDNWFTLWKDVRFKLVNNLRPILKRRIDEIFAALPMKEI